MAESRGKGKRKLKKWLLIPAVIFLLLIAVGFSVRITEVTVTGNSRCSSEEITRILFPTAKERNLVYCYLNDRLGDHKKIPYVEDYDLEFVSPTHVEVIVYEKSIVGYLRYMSSYMYFDKDGIIVDSTNEKLEGVPEVTGLEFGHIALYAPLPVEDSQVFDEILSLTQALYDYEIQVDEIHFGARNQVTLKIGEIDVELGSSDSINGKVAVLHDTLPVLEGQAGTLYLDSYDEANTSRTYTFKKRS
ncbi:MAG TPA: FtsQ-type POTRA domain-containing protein [Candidatus Lachnoclostridium stercorigallinarum]|uniref:FtsQ-type POTRA domain-containing protein n=1 Tax=Candidatus Lachnoclostridium stercorigallinarum TaxID=2838634 RepID=A0A9D2GG54_9FIRM|nr:FtsQ-type POTRA domain-containing protein [Candidatus Lachnoclostridium stercorigallinarum]